MTKLEGFTQIASKWGEDLCRPDALASVLDGRDPRKCWLYAVPGADGRPIITRHPWRQCPPGVDPANPDSATALAAVDDIHERGLLPMLCVGSGSFAVVQISFRVRVDAEIAK